MAERRRRPAAAPRAATGLALLGLLGLTGCCDLRLAPRSAQQAVQRINDNVGRISGVLYAKATTSFRFRDQRGRDQRFLFHPAALRFEPPRCLVFEIRSSIGGSLANLGSSDERYWLWIDTPDMRKLWWGSWEALEAGLARDMTPPPDLLLDALMMRPLENTGSARLFVLGCEQRLTLDRPGGGSRELRLDPAPPHMPLEVIDRDAQRRVAMRALLSGYRPLDDEDPETSPQLARHYAVYWPLQKAELRLDLDSLKYPDLDTRMCVFPSRWNGDVECLNLSSAADGQAPAAEDDSE